MSHEATDIERALRGANALSHGHFRYESGHHGDLWLDLDVMFGDARRMRDWAAALAELMAGDTADAVCGPLTGGAFVAQLLAAELGADLVFAERLVAADAVAYRIPDALRPIVRGRRVVLVDDAVNAGSALQATLDDLRGCGARLVGLASLLSLGDGAARIARKHGVPFHRLAALDSSMWQPQDCPRCKAGEPLEDRVPRA